MKTCPICHREYSDSMKYCTRDGTSLKTTTSFDTSFCSLCNQYYPLATVNCPVHGIALNTNSKSSDSNEKFEQSNSSNEINSSEINSSEINSNKIASSEIASSEINSNEISSSEISSNENVLSKKVSSDIGINNLSPIVANILQEIMSSSSGSLSKAVDSQKNLDNSSPSDEIADRLKTNSDLNESLLEANKAKETQNLNPPFVVPSESLGQYASQVSADRKLLISLALIGALSIIGFAAYSIPYALHRSKVSANTQPPITTLPQETPSQEALPKEPLAQETPSQETALNKQVTEPNIINIAPKAEPVSSTETAQSSEDIPIVQSIPDLSAKGKSTENTKSTSNTTKTKSAEPLKIDSGKAPLTIKSPSKVNSEVALGNKTTSKPAVISNSKATIITPSSSSDKWDKITSNRPSTDNKNTPVNSGSAIPVKSEPSRSDRCNKGWNIPASTTAQIKYPQRAVAKVVATIANKSRVQTSNGYIYQFELIVKEIGGVGVNWDVTSVSRSSYSGRNSVVSGFLEKHLLGNGHVRYSMAIRMTGSSIEDWYGQITYNCSGVDENGNPVELHQLLALDNSFPTSER